MCVNYVTVSRQTLNDIFNIDFINGVEWPPETYQDYLAPIIIGQHDGPRRAVAAAYSMIPKQRMAPGVKRYATMNARAETVGQLRSYAPAWRAGQLCLVPMHAYYEPNYESGVPVRWRIGMADGAAFAVAGLYRTWQDVDGVESYSFTQLTVNADQHGFLNRFHKPDDEKRALVVVRPEQFDDWLACRDAERAREYLHLLPEQVYSASPAPRARLAKHIDECIPEPANLSLF